MLLVDVNQNIFKTDDGDVVTEPDNISNSFNNFFVEVGPKLASPNTELSGKYYFEYLLNPTQKSLFMKPIVADEVVKITSKHYQNKSPGHDGFGSLIVNKVASIISKPLTDIFNLSLSTGIVPEQLKLAKVSLYPSIKKRILKYSKTTVLYLYYLAFQKY